MAQTHSLLINKRSKVIHFVPGLGESCNTDQIPRQHRQYAFNDQSDEVLNYWIGKGYTLCKKCKR